jgi:hypothetical protein
MRGCYRRLQSVRAASPREREGSRSTRTDGWALTRPAPGRVVRSWVVAACVPSRQRRCSDGDGRRRRHGRPRSRLEGQRTFFFEVDSAIIRTAKLTCSWNGGWIRICWSLRTATSRAMQAKDLLEPWLDRVPCELCYDTV